MTKKLILMLSLFAFLLVGSAARAGFGVSPPRVANKNLVPGSFYEQTVYLVQNDPSEVLHAKVQVDAPDISSWIKIENGNTFDIPKGQQQFPMKVSVTVPPDAKLGNYTGTITVNTTPASANTGGVQITLGGEIKIDLDVTSAVVSDFSIQSFQIPDTKVGEPIKFLMKVKNDGNVDNGPTKVALTFFDDYHSKQLGQEEKEVSQKVKSFQTGDIPVDFKNNLQDGQYWADAKIYSDDKVVVDSKIMFNVGNGGSKVTGEKEGAFSLKMPDLSKIPAYVYWIAGLGVVVLMLIIVIIVMLIRSKKKGKTSSRKEPAGEDKKIKIKIKDGNDK